MELSRKFKKLSTVQFFDAKNGMEEAIQSGLAQLIDEKVRRQRIFICHASEDRNRIDEFISNHGLSDAYIWYDSQKVPNGINVDVGIRSGIDRASNFIAFITQNFISRLTESKWIQLEIALALERELNTPGFAVFYLLDYMARPSELDSMFKCFKSPDKEFIKMFQRRRNPLLIRKGLGQK